VIRKHVPVAAGMGGGSADAAAVLRVARALTPVEDGVIAPLAAALGADVPSQLVPGVALGTAAGEVIERVDPLAPHAFVIVPQDFGLSTAEVYREADRLGLPRSADELALLCQELRAALGADAWLPAGLLINDLEPAAVALRPEVGGALEAVRDAGAEHVMVSGSGPTVFGVFTGVEAGLLAAAAAGALRDRYPGAISAAPVTEDFGAPRGS
jgi:4-diphosphocytidyl-2-C-methyl-D-erythritol kinase